MTVIGFTDQDHWEKIYNVMCVNRGDLQSAGLSVTQVDALTEEDMVQIAARLEEAIIQAGIWDDVAFVARIVLAEKGEQSEHTSSCLDRL